jgi:hypothetical protein
MDKGNKVGTRPGAMRSDHKSLAQRRPATVAGCRVKGGRQWCFGCCGGEDLDLVSRSLGARRLIHRPNGAGRCDDAPGLPYRPRTPRRGLLPQPLGDMTALSVTAGSRFGRDRIELSTSAAPRQV